MKFALHEGMTESEERIVRRGLDLFTSQFNGPPHLQEVGIVLRDEYGKARGGISGYTMWNWLRTDVLWLPEQLRGNKFGHALLERAESIARNRGCTSAMLYAFEFQTRGFFEAHGYRVEHKVEDFPLGHIRYLLIKGL